MGHHSTDTRVPLIVCKELPKRVTESTGPMPEWMDDAFRRAVAAVGLITNAAGRPVSVTAGRSPRGALGWIVGPPPDPPDGPVPPPNEIGLDLHGIAARAGIPTGLPLPSDPADPEQLEELIERVLRHEKGHAEGAGSPPDSSADPCGHARFGRDVDAAAICARILWRRSRGLEVDKLCRFCRWFRSAANSVIRSACSPNEPLITACRDAGGSDCCPGPAGDVEASHPA